MSTKVKIRAWAVVRSDGTVWTVHPSEGCARNTIKHLHQLGAQRKYLVLLTGTFTPLTTKASKPRTRK